MPRHLLTRVAPLAAAALAATACTDPLATRPTAASDADPALHFESAPVTAEPDTSRQFIVFYKPGQSGLADPSTAGTAVAAGTLHSANAAVYRGVSDPARLASDANVAQVIPNIRSALHDVSATSYPTSATYFRRGYQWDMRQIGADQVPTAVQGTGARVCIIDTGIDKTHQELRGKVVAETSFVDTAHGYNGPGYSAPGADSISHGTHVASTVTGNGVSMGSTAPRALLMTAKVFPGDGSGAYLSAILDGIDWCSANGADVINMSLGALLPAQYLPTAPYQNFIAVYQSYVDLARSRGTVVIASAGNNGVQLDKTNPNLGLDVPAQLKGVVSIGATGPVTAPAFPFNPAPPAAVFDALTAYTNYGPDVTVYAPGGAGYFNYIQGNVIAACSSYRAGCAGGRVYWSIQGTSMSAPHASGVAAIITSRSTAPRSMSRAQAVEACIASTGDNITATVGTVSNVRPRINAAKAATAACSGL